MDLIRAFIAFPVPEEVRRKLAKAQDVISQGMHHLRPVHPDAIHMTLNFLGDIQSSKVYTIGEVMQRVCDAHGPIELICRKIGAFPDLKNPKVLWAGLDGEVDALKNLQLDLQSQLSDLGFQAEDRSFHAHLTLFRIKRLKQLGALRKRIEKVSKDDFGMIRCDPMIFYKSDLQPTGAVYTKLKMVGL